MEIKRIPINQLKPAPYNPRKISRHELEKLKKSIETYGYVQPLIWNKRTGHVVGGNQRLKVLKELGFKEVDVVVVDLDLTQEKALNLALNRISGDWDFHSLAQLLDELLNEIDDMELTGFDWSEVAAIIEGFDIKEPTPDVLKEIEEEELFARLQVEKARLREVIDFCKKAGIEFRR